MKLGSCALLAAIALVPPASDLLWPLGSGFVRYPLRATYGQLEGEGTNADLHHGLDILPKKAVEPVYALESGEVVAVEKDLGFYSGIVVESASGEAFLYLHLEGDTIPWTEHADVEVDDYLGDVVHHDDGKKVRHLHLSRLADWNHDWVGLDRWSIGNPLTMIDPALLGDDEAPVIDDIGSERLAARKNENPNTTQDPPYYDLDSLPAGNLDVLALVYDLDGSDSGLKLAPYGIELTIDAGEAGEEEFELVLDGSLRPYLEREKALYNLDDTKPSDGDTFYFAPTNAGAPASTTNAWWAVKGKHTLHVRVYDVKGKETTYDCEVEVN